MKSLDKRRDVGTFKYLFQQFVYVLIVLNNYKPFMLRENRNICTVLKERSILALQIFVKKHNHNKYM